MSTSVYKFELPEDGKRPQANVDGQPGALAAFHDELNANSDTAPVKSNNGDRPKESIKSGSDYHNVDLAQLGGLFEGMFNRRRGVESSNVSASSRSTQLNNDDKAFLNKIGMPLANSSGFDIQALTAAQQRRQDFLNKGVEIFVDAGMKPSSGLIRAVSSIDITDIKTRSMVLVESGRTDGIQLIMKNDPATKQDYIDQVRAVSIDRSRSNVPSFVSQSDREHLAQNGVNQVGVSSPSTDAGVIGTRKDTIARLLTGQGWNQAVAASKPVEEIPVQQAQRVLPLQENRTTGAQSEIAPVPPPPQPGLNTENQGAVDSSGIPLPSLPHSVSEKPSLPEIVPEKSEKVNYERHGLTIDCGYDKEGNLVKITSSFSRDKYPDGKKDQVYVKRGDGWFYQLANGEEQHMQGDLRYDKSKKTFTQVLRKDIDGNNPGQETTRTMSVDGTDTINRMDGTKSIFKYDEKGQMAEWIEQDLTGQNTKTFQPIKDDQGRAAWKCRDEIRYGSHVEDNGNVTYKTKADLDASTNKVVTTAGESITNGENGVKYTFNDRGDVASIEFPRERLFEGQKVKRVEVAYRDPINNQSQIIDSLTLFNKDGFPFRLIQREGANKADAGSATNSWNVFAASNKDNQYKHVQKAIGDFAIKDGHIMTTEPLPKETALANDAKLKALLESHKDKQHPQNIIYTYNNSANPSETDKPNSDEYTVDFFKSNNPNDALDYQVPGENVAVSQAPVFQPPSARPPVPLPPVPKPPVPKPVEPEGPKPDGESQRTRVVSV